MGNETKQLNCDFNLPIAQYRPSSAGAYCGKPAVAGGRCEEHAWKPGDTRVFGREFPELPKLPPEFAWQIVLETWSSKTGNGEVEVVASRSTSVSDFRPLRLRTALKTLDLHRLDPSLSEADPAAD
jgi:hypothetical protein